MHDLYLRQVCLHREIGQTTAEAEAEEQRRFSPCRVLGSSDKVQHQIPRLQTSLPLLHSLKALSCRRAWRCAPWGVPAAVWHFGIVALLTRLRPQQLRQAWPASRLCRCFQHHVSRAPLSWLLATHHIALLGNCSLKVGREALSLRSIRSLSCVSCCRCSARFWMTWTTPASRTSCGSWRRWICSALPAPAGCAEMTALKRPRQNVLCLLLLIVDFGCSTKLVLGL